MTYAARTEQESEKLSRKAKKGKRPGAERIQMLFVRTTKVLILDGAGAQRTGMLETFPQEAHWKEVFPQEAHREEGYSLRGRGHSCTREMEIYRIDGCTLRQFYTN